MLKNEIEKKIGFLWYFILARLTLPLLVVNLFRKIYDSVKYPGVRHLQKSLFGHNLVKNYFCRFCHTSAEDFVRNAP